MNNKQSIALMIGGGILIAIGLPSLFLGFFMFNEFDLYIGSFGLVTGIILLKIGDNWLWANNPKRWLDKNT